jgi:hypothetical protein
MSSNSTKYIYYTGPDIIIKKEHPNSKWRNKIALKQNNLYKLGINWEGDSFNEYWTFYVFDDLNKYETKKDYRGYEINVKYIQTLRTYNLEKLI